jgi:hypothetical protein
MKKQGNVDLSQCFILRRFCTITIRNGKKSSLNLLAGCVKGGRALTRTFTAVLQRAINPTQGGNVEIK